MVQSAETSNPVTFVVDRRVDFLVSPEAPDPEGIAPSQAGLFLPFTITNLSNDTLDFSLAFRTLANGETYRSGTETATGEIMETISIEVAPDLVGTAGEFPSRGANISSIDDLGPGEQIRVYIYSDAPSDLPDGSQPALELSATALDSAGAALSDDTLVVDDPAVVQNVLVNATDTLVEVDGFAVTAADITALKSSTVLSDPFGSANPKAVPGAVVQYSITVTNGASGLATGITIRDILVDALVSLETTTVTRSVSGDCVADGNPGDGCTLLPSGTPGESELSVDLSNLANGASETITFQVRIQ